MEALIDRLRHIAEEGLRRSSVRNKRYVEMRLAPARKGSDSLFDVVLEYPVVVFQGEIETEHHIISSDVFKDFWQVDEWRDIFNRAYQGRFSKG